MSDLQVSIDALRSFAKAIRNNVLGSDGANIGLSGDDRINQPMQGLSVLDFGQGVPGLDAASTLAHDYRTAFLGQHDNRRALNDALSTLATAAEKIAQSYADAASLDVVSAKMVDDTIAGSKPTTLTTGPA